MFSRIIKIFLSKKLKLKTFIAVACLFLYFLAFSISSVFVIFLADLHLLDNDFFSFSGRAALDTT